MLDFLVKHKKMTIGVGIGLFLAIIVISVFFIIQDSLKTAKVNIYVAPSTAVVRLNGRAYGSMEEARIEPGEYNVEITAEGFVTKTGKIVAFENGVAEIKTYLEPEEWNTDYYTANPGDALIVGEIKAADVQAAVEKLKEEYPVLNVLPIEIDFFTKNYAARVKYTVSYRMASDHKSFVITITDYTGGNYENALDKLTARGFNPKDYTIEYIDATSSGVNGKAF